MAITSSQIPGALLPGARKIAGMYNDIPTQWSLIYATGTSHMEAERTIHMRYLPLPELKQQGTPTTFDNGAGQRFTYNHIHVAFGLGYSFTREAMDDNLYKSAFNPANLGLVSSFKQMEEIQGAATLNTGNVLNPQIGGDNQPLFSTSHPIDGGTVANTPQVQVGLNEASLTMANNMARRFRDNAGLLKPAQARKLVVPVELRHDQQRYVVREREQRPVERLRGPGLPHVALRVVRADRRRWPDLPEPHTVRDVHADRLHHRQPDGEGVHEDVHGLRRFSSWYRSISDQLSRFSVFFLAYVGYKSSVARR